MNADPNPAKAIFLEAVERHTPDQWPAFLDRVCASQPELRSQVEALLGAHRQVGTAQHRELVESADSSPVATIELPSATEAPGMVVGPYKLIEQIGEGGMGAVWMAQQTEPVKRLVAVKLIKAGMDSKQVIARFEAERQALALMDHPNIARVLDAGTTDAGRPYFVMDLVRGVPITTYCDEHHLTPRQRLELFVPVCQAIQHAHQKGVIHRDLKPTNVLVALYDGRPVPKVIDFGIAKAAGQPLTDKTLVTGFGAIVGTLEYMSPEQAEINQLDIDTRSDVYSLGVLLYELLTGSTPFTKKDLGRAGMLEMLRVIREQEPSKPSTKLSTADGLPTLAANRGTEPAKLTRLLRGELDWIVMKALEKDRNRRYETASGFAMDVQRHLSDETVQACPPSVGYRVRKFVRRNRPHVVAGTLVLAALLIGLSGSVWGMIRANAARRDVAASEQDAQEKRRAAEVAEEKEIEQRKIAVAEAELAKGIKEFLQKDVLQLAHPYKQHGIWPELPYNGEARLRDVVLRAADLIDGRFKNQPLVEAEVRQTLGYALSGLGRQDLAVKQRERVREIYRVRLGPDHGHTHAAALNLARCYSELGRHAEACKLCEELLPHLKTRHGPGHDLTIQGMNALSDCYRCLGRLDEALKLDEEALALAKTKYGPDHLFTIVRMHFLAASYHLLDREAEALKLYKEVFAFHQDRSGPDHPATFPSMSGLIACYTDLGDYAEALKLSEELLALKKVTFGLDHPETMRSMFDLAISYANLGRYSEAQKLYEKTVTLRRARLGPDHPNTLRAIKNLAVCHHNLREYAKAQKLLEEALTLLRARRDPLHSLTLETMNRLAYTHLKIGLDAEALKLSEEALAIGKTKLGPKHPDTLNSLQCLSDVLPFVGRHSEALKIKEELLALRKATLGPTHPKTIFTMSQLALLFTDLRRDAEALKLHEEVLAWQKARRGPDHPSTLIAMMAIAANYSGLNHPEALKLIEEALARSKAVLGPKHNTTLTGMNLLATRYMKLGRHPEGMKLREELLALMKSTEGPDHPKTLTVMFDLAYDLSTVGRDAEALKLHKETLALRKVRLGPDHKDTLASTLQVAEMLSKLDRGAEALPYIDKIVTPAAGRPLNFTVMRQAIDLRLKHFQKAGDAAGCRATAAMWEKFDLRDGDSLYTASRYRAVTASLQRKAPGADAARLAREDADQAMIWLSKAVAAFEKAIELNPKDAWAYRYLASILLEQNKRAEAVAAFEKAIELNPKDAWAYRHLAGILFDQNKREEAAAAYDKAIELDPKDAGAWCGRGWLHMLSGELDKALADQAKAIELEPEAWLHWNNRSVTYLKLGQLEKAIADSSKAIELDSKFAQPWFNRAEAYRRLGRHELAASDYRKAIDLKTLPMPDVPLAYRHLAGILFDQNKREEAAAAFDKAIELNPKDAWAWGGRGWLHMLSGELDKALADHAKAIELEPKERGHWNDRSVTYLKLGHLEKAIADSSKAIELDPTLAQSWFNRAEAHRRLGRHELAVRDYRKAIDLKTLPMLDVPLAHRNLAGVLNQMGSKEEARKEYEYVVELSRKAVELAPNDDRLWQALGWDQYRAGAWETSIESLEQSCKLQQGGTGDSGQWIVLALAHARLAAQDSLPEEKRSQHRAEARRWYEQAVKQIDTKNHGGKPTSQAIKAFRVEADELIGPKAKKD